jgi:hypothetical protein
MERMGLQALMEHRVQMVLQVLMEHREVMVWQEQVVLMEHREVMVWQEQVVLMEQVVQHPQTQLGWLQVVQQQYFIYGQEHWLNIMD